MAYESDWMSALLFVYGSLKRGFENHHHLAPADYVDSCTTGPGYALFHVGRYPALVRAGAGSVQGELYQVEPDLLDHLDVFEGCPTLYQRQTLRLEDGRTAFAYVMPGERVAGCKAVHGGRWSEKDLASRA